MEFTITIFQTFMFPNQNNGRFNVLEDGTLIIESVRREDAGEYSCQALSMSGSAVANVRIDVKGQRVFRLLK